MNGIYEIQYVSIMYVINLLLLFFCGVGLSP
jgi:hypothetical protein